MADYKIKVGVELDANNFNTEIKKYTEKKQNVNVTAILDTQKVDDKIKKYRDNPKQIKLSSTLDMQKVDEKIKKYRDTPKQIKLLSTLDMQKVDDKIKSYNDNPKKIKVDAVLNDESIKSQIDAFPKDKKIYLNAELDNSAISNAIKEFNNALSTASDRAKISVGVNPDFSNVETAISKYSTNKEIQIYPKLRIGEIAKQIKEYRTTHKDSLEKIYLRAEFKDDAISTAISNYRTFHGDKLKLPIDLTLGNDKELDTKVAAKVAEKTNAYQSKPVEVPVVLKPATRGFDTKIRKPIEVDVVLKDGAINSALENPKNLSRIPIDVRLKPKDINEEIRKLKPLVTEPLDVGVKLDETSANTAISTFKPTSLLDVGIDLNEASVNNAIAAFKPTALLNVSVDPNSGNNIDEKTGKKMAGAPLKVNVELDRDSINDQIKTFKAVSKLNIGVDVDFASHKGGQKGVPQQIKEYKTKTKIKIGAEIDKDSINQEIQGFKTDTPIRLGVELDTENVQPQIDNIRRQLQELENINLNLGRNGNNGGNNGGNNDNGSSDREERRRVDETTQAYRDLIGVLNELNSKKLQLNNLDASSPQSSEKIQRLRLQIEQLENEYDNLISSFNAQGIQFTADQWNELETIIARVGRRIDVVQAGMSDKSVIKSQTQAYKELLSVSKEISSLEINVAKLKNQGGNTNQIAELESQLKTLQNTYQQLVTSMETPLTADQWSSIYTQITKTQEELARLQAKYVDTREELAREINIKLADGSFDNDLSNINDKFEKIKDKSTELQVAMDEVNAALSRIRNASNNDNTEELIKANQDYEKALKAVKNQLDINARAERKASDNLKLEDDIAAFQSKIDAWLTKNSAAAQQFGDKLHELRVQAENCDRETLDHLEREFKQVDKAAEAAGKKTKTFGDSLKAQFEKYRSYFSIASLFMYAEQAMRNMFEQVKLIDSAMTELKKVTDETDESYNKFLTNAASKAKEIGTTIDGLVASTADFARLGYGFEDSQKLAEVANIYAVVGDEIEGVEDATQSLVSTLAAFKEEMNGMSDSDFAEGIVDKMNEVSNNFAISSGGIGEALQRSASSMAAANNSLDETIALITAANTVAQNPEKVGNAFKTMSMRIRGAKTELEEAGESTDGMAESTASLRAEIKALSGVDIMLNENTFKSTYQIMDELSQKWEDLSDIAQATIIELVAGKHQGNVFSSLMANFDIAKEALNTSLNSSGSAMREHAKWSESLEAKLLKLKATWQSLSQSFMSSNFLKSALDGVISLVNALDGLIDTFGTLPTLIGAFAGIKSLFSNKGIFTFDKDTKSLQIFGDSLKDLKANIGKVSTAVNTYNSNLSKSTGLQNAYVKAINQQNSGLGKYLSGLNGAKASMGGYVRYLALSTVKTVALQAATTLLNAAMTMGISFLISTGISAIMKLANAKSDLAEKVAELTSKFKEQHEELQKLKGDYDTTNESSMISKYEKLSKGVDGLGRNISLTADEYSEYQGIVDSIAEQFPSLISGYDEQGNALLSCKDNVEALTEAYEKLIHAQNQEILTNSGKIEKDFENTLKNQSGTGWWSNNHGFWKGFDFFELADYDLKSNTVEALSNILNAGNTKQRKERIKQLKNNPNNPRSDVEIRTALENAGIDIKWYEDVYKVLEKTLETEPTKIQNIIDNYYSQFAEAVDEQKTIAQAKLSEAFDISNVISGLNYGNIGEELQSIAYQVVNSLDFDFFEDLKEKGMTVEQWTKEMLDQLNSIGKADNAQIEAAFDLQTKFNGGEIPYGEYVQGLKDTENVIRNLRVNDNVKEQLRISLGLDEDGIIEQYKQLKNRLADEELFDIMPEDYESFINSLSSEELSVLISLIPELSETDYRETIEDIKAALEKEMMLQGLTFDLNLEVESAGIEALNTALAESVSATGLSSESIKALKGRYADLESQGYDLSSMFEETSHGIRLNRQEFNKLEKAYATKKLADIDSDLDEMKIAYDDLGEAIKNCDDPIKKSELFNERQTLAKRISEAATLASQYEGLTSAYNDWLAAEEAGQERDMYEKVIEGFKNIDDEIKRGWLDDGTIEFLELLTGEDLSTAGIEKQKAAYKSLGEEIENTSYSVRDFFTVDEDGNSTNAGVYNFLDAIGQLEEEKFGGKDVVKRDKDGNIIAFDFKIAGGDEAIAEALGISEELVQIMVRAADDAGFVISMDGTYRQLADLQNEAKAAADYLHQIGKTDFEFDFNTSSVENLKTQLEEAHKILDSKNFWNKDGTFNFNVDGATEAMQVVSTLQAKLDKLTEEKYGIGLTVEDEKFEEPLEKLQEYGRNVATLNQLKLNPKANAKEIEELNGELDTIAQDLIDLSKNDKIDIGIDANDNIEDVKKKIENGEIKIPTVLDIQANMDKNIETLADLALLNSGLLSDDEEEVIRKKYKIEATADEVDTSKVDEKVDEALNGDGGFTGRGRKRNANIEIVAETFGIEDIDYLTYKLKGLDDKTIQAIAEVVGQIDVDKLRTTLMMVNPVHVEAIAEAIGKGDVDALKEAIGKLHPNHVQAIAEALGFDEVSDLNAAIENLDPKTVQVVAEALGITDVDSLKAAIDNVKDKDVEVNATTSGEEELSGLKKLIDNIKSKTVTITSWFKKITSGGSTRNDSNGYSDVNGTTGRAFKQGSWGTKNSGTALVGELGRETLVRNGRYYTIGDDGAEFIKYQKGDIIFNHKQTEELFANGKVTSGGGRAKAFASGTAFSSGVGGIGRVVAVREADNGKKKIKTETKSSRKAIEVRTTIENQQNNSNGSSGTGGGAGSAGGSSVDGNKDYSGKDKEKTEESFDWIETAINRVERAIDNLDRKANNVYASWSSRNEALSDEISKVGDEIALQERARQGYLAEANRVGLSSSWISKVQSGAIDIDTVTDENLAKKINDYKAWYEKALACEDAIEELKITESDLYKQKFDNIVTRYEGILDDIEHEKDLIEEYISQHENRNLSDFVAHDIKDYEVIAEYYQDLITQEQKNLIQLQKEKAELVAEFNSGNIKEGTEAWNEMQAKIHDVDLAIQQANTSIIELNNDIAQSYKDAFDDIASQFDHMISVIEFKKNMIDEGISHSEAQGWLVSGEYYEALIDMEQDNIDKLQEKKADLLAQLERGVTAEGKSIPMYSEAWWEMCEEIDATTLAIEQSNNALLEYEQTLQQLSWETFDLLEEKISAVTEEADFLVDLLSNKKLFDDNGQLTNEGMATMGLHGQNYNTHMYQADLAAEEAEKLKKELESDPFDMELEERYREIVALQQEHILAAEAEKDAIKDMVEEGINLELEALQEKIDLYNEALDSQKDLYDYQRKVKEQTEEIASLEKQMAAYQNDNSEEAQAKIQELKVSLEDAKANLEETEYDKYISDQKQMLDALYLEYETILNERLDNIDALVIGVIEQINANAIGINTTLQEAATSVGYTLSTEMQNIWGLAAAQMQNDAAERVRETTRIVDELVANGKLSHEDANKIVAALGSGEASGVKNATDIINRLVEEGRLSSQDAHLINTTMTTTGNEYKGVVTTYGNNFTSAQTTTNSALRTINTNLQSMISQLNSIASTKVASAKVSSSTTSKQATAGSGNSKPKTETPKVEAPKTETPKTETHKVETPKKDSGDGVAAIGDKVKFVSGKYYYDPQGKAPLGSKNLGKEVYITNINKHSWATHPIHISTGSKLGSGDLGWLKKSQISGYAIGKEKFFDDEIAWTQEGNKQEFIVRPSDGAILTPIAKGDSVLNAVASRNIWDMANNPAEFIRDNLSFGSNSIPNNSNVQSNYTQNLDKVVFNLPNVHSYEELLSAMQKDKNFERLITSMTIDRLAGKSSLAKGKAIR